MLLLKSGLLHPVYIHTYIHTACMHASTMAVIAWSAAEPLMLIGEGGWMLLEREHQDRRMRTHTFRYPLP